MKSKQLISILIAAGAFLFNIVFWNEQLALNALLFDVFIIGSIFYCYNASWKSPVIAWLLPAHALAAVSFIVFHSAVANIAFIITFLLLVSFVLYTHRSVWLAGGSLLVGFFQFTGNFSGLLKNKQPRHTRRMPVRRFLRFAIFPLLIAFLFIIIYSGANDVFADLAGDLGIFAESLFNSFFSLFSFGRFLFLLLGFYITGTLLLRARPTSFETTDAFATDNMHRVRKKRMDIHRSLAYDLTVGVMGKLAKGPLALKNEYRTGITSLVLLNILLLIINGIDINYLWIHFSYNPSIDLYTMIHEGTELLILSIIMAMAVLLIFFRGNLNFYKQNKWLRYGAYLWLFQNTVLVVSVLLRDYYYIREFGLAYKRIGVLFFLLLVLAGLATVFLKVRFAKTNYYLFRINAWCAVFLLVTGAAFQWDVFIAEYNIAHRKSAPLNLPYLLTLSDKVLPVLHAKLDALKEREKELNSKGIYVGGRQLSLEEVLAIRVQDYQQEQSHYSWLSWNYTDAAQKKYFTQHPAITAMHK
jgi:hypothetical protein